MTRHLETDVLVIGGGTAGTMAALSAATAGANVLLLEKAHVRHSGALAMGMDGVNNAVIPGKATPEDYVREITRANDGIVDQRTVHQTATRGHAMVQRLESYGVKFEKDEYGEYAVRQVHRSGRYVLPMPEGRDIKKVLYRVLRRRDMREKIQIENRVMPVRVLTDAGRAVGAAGFDTRSGEFVTVAANAVVLATGACGRLGLPASGYLYGTYENPTNAGDGYAMAYHAGAELSGIECFQINPLIKDYNGPACAYVANPFGGYQVNNRGERFVDCDYWSGQMMSEVARELESDRGPIYLKLSHLPDETISAVEGILHTTERPSRGTFHSGRGHDYRTHDIEMHISEIGLCGGHSASGVWVDENGATTVPGLYAAGDLACVPHNYMIGAFVFGDLAGTHAAGLPGRPSAPLPEDQIEAARELIHRPQQNPDGPPQQQVEYKLRRFVNDYVAPPKSAAKLEIAVETFQRMNGEIDGMGGRTPHELMRCVEVTFIRDCAEMAARASLVRTESRWGLYHDRTDHPERDDESWLYHLNLRKGADGEMEFIKRPVAEYLFPVDDYRPPAGDAPIAVPEPRRFTTASHRRSGDRTSGGTSTGAAARIVAVLALADQLTAGGSDSDRPAESPGTVGAPSLPGAAGSGPAVGAPGSGAAPGGLDSGLAAFATYLTDDDAAVRRTAVMTLTEVAPPGAAGALVDALADADSSVRAAAAAGLRELADVLPADDALAARLRTAYGSTDAGVREVVIELLRVIGLGTIEDFRAGAEDVEVTVRLQAVRGLVRRDDVAGLAAAAMDPAREVRVAAAHGFGTVGDPAAASAVHRLISDDDPLVRAAAWQAAAPIGCPGPLPSLAVEALGEAAWQVREGAAKALAAAPPEVAVPPLLAAATDPNLDVRRAAIRALAGWPDHPDVVNALATAATDDPDADVRAWARRARAVPA
ncbi:fumarate reductase/succinate dehydrogenase flavoprotein-like FrdA [Actinoplanes italicus]|uniref:Succinate dehydrogenase/fumarate reductase flavoprotein subunit n=1 Tax=Actinoplanes italicus TaxID=113567 RepID=A0A2T0JY89_9ACTN|nr:fumarate reductase/succinate dehydrogenase flavoprotein subunit [Actinoplanes italicus]PRX13833.1 succinate dehydrogenase/fumarate reductase flavoprotein subunit [Actinoplanes italicus]GIE36878.1 fumarate reductase/succinate dehydrogenase flavoprotein-like FrdA [Actinoplanes italicus]